METISDFKLTITTKADGSTEANITPLVSKVDFVDYETYTFTGTLKDGKPSHGTIECTKKLWSLTVWHN